VPVVLEVTEAMVSLLGKVHPVAVQEICDPTSDCVRAPLENVMFAVFCVKPTVGVALELIVSFHFTSTKLATELATWMNAT
jgi:hypothetical protein